jgi:hypothetical protein
MAPLLPSTRLVACPACREHVKTDAAACPHCGAALPSVNRLGFASAAIVGLALSGCPDKDTMTTAEPEYGVATTEPLASTGNDTEPGTGTGTGTSMTAGTGTMSGTGTTMEPQPDYGTATFEPEYGVPTTDATTSTGTSTSTGTTTMGTGGEPEYGVPETSSEPDYGVPGTTGG